jgi:hypothetical protein
MLKAQIIPHRLPEAVAGRSHLLIVSRLLSLIDWARRWFSFTKKFIARAFLFLLSRYLWEE